MQEPSPIEVFPPQTPFNTVNQRPELEHIDVLFSVKRIGMGNMP